MLSFKVSLLKQSIQFIQWWKKESLFRQKKKIVIEDLSLLIEMFSLKIRNAPLICLVRFFSYTVIFQQ